MGTVRELRGRAGSEVSPLIRLIVNDTPEESKVIHFHRARMERRAVRISHPSMFSEHRFPWDPGEDDRTDPSSEETQR